MSRIIVSAHVEGRTQDQQNEAHGKLTQRLLERHTEQAYGKFNGVVEKSIVWNIPHAPFIWLFNEAYKLAQEFDQNSVYFSHKGKAYLATHAGDIEILGIEREEQFDKGLGDYTRILCSGKYIFTENEK